MSSPVAEENQQESGSEAEGGRVLLGLRKALVAGAGGL
jgi:hypothetical protein